MSIKTLLTTIALVAGTSSAALARPIERHELRNYRMQAYRVMPHRGFERREPHRWYRPTASYYYEAPPVQEGFQSGQNSQFLPLGGTIGSGIEVELVQGEDQAFVDQLVIHYADGRDVPMHLDRSLNAYSPELQLPTENCAINGVTVIGNGAVRAERI